MTVLVLNYVQEDRNSDVAAPALRFTTDENLNNRRLFQHSVPSEDSTSVLIFCNLFKFVWYIPDRTSYYYFEHIKRLF
jgi:hypothetical protein